MRRASHGPASVTILLVVLGALAGLATRGEAHDEELAKEVPGGGELIKLFQSPM